MASGKKIASAFKKQERKSHFYIFHRETKKEIKGKNRSQSILITLIYRHRKFILITLFNSFKTNTLRSGTKFDCYLVVMIEITS